MDFLFKIFYNKTMSGKKKAKGRLRVNPPVIEMTPDDEAFLKKLKAIVKRFLADPDLDADILRMKLLMARATLYDKTRKLTGLSVGEYIKFYRLEKAAELLKDKSRSVTEVAMSLGFSTAQFFATCFREQHELSPSEYKSFYLRKNEKKLMVDRILLTGNKPHDKQVEPQSISPQELAKELDRELVAQGRQILSSSHMFKGREGTPQRDEVFKRVMKLYDLNSAIDEALKKFSIEELTKKILCITEEANRGAATINGTIVKCQDFYEINDAWMQRNALSVAAVCLAEDLSVTGDWFSTLKVLNYGETFNLNEEEPFRSQPVAAGAMCSGVPVADDIMAVPAHFANEKNVSRLRFVFDFIMQDPCTPPVRISNENIYNGVEILDRVHNPDSDWALVKLDRKIKDREIAVLSGKQIFHEQPVYVIGNPLGLPLKVAQGTSVGQLTDDYFRADLDIYSSAGGSPVFCAGTHQLIGMVSRSQAADFRWTGSDWLSLPYPKTGDNQSATRCTRVSQFINT